MLGGQPIDPTMGELVGGHSVYMCDAEITHSIFTCQPHEHTHTHTHTHTHAHTHTHN